MTKISPATKLSSHLKPLDCNIRISKTSIPVIKIPTGSGIPKSKFKAIAEPITSAKSQAIMAISHKTHKIKFTVGEKWSLQACAKSLSAAIPSFKDKC